MRKLVVFCLALFVSHVYANDTLYTNWTLQSGDSLYSANQKFRLTMQGDGNLVLHYNDVPTWASNTWGRGDSFLILQGDSNLVIYTHTGVPTWASASSWNKGGDRFVVQGDGNMVIYAGSTPVWQSDTWQTLYPRLLPAIDTSLNKQTGRFVIESVSTGRELTKDASVLGPSERWFANGRGSRAGFYIAWDNRGYAELRRSIYANTNPQKECLQIRSTRNRSKVDDRTCDGGENQKWEIIGRDYQGGDTSTSLEYTLKSKAAGRCLDIAGDGEAQIYDCNNTGPQRFRFRPQ